MPTVHEIKKLPTITALRYHDEFSSGANKPILVTGVDKESGEQKECVIKMMASERMRPEAAAFELVASFLAWEWGISVVHPVLIDISKEFVETIHDRDQYLVASQSVGLNYGSIHQPNYETLPFDLKLNKKQLLQAQKNFAFDIFIGNADRNFNKPNCMYNADEIIIYDHELAFSFLHLIFGSTEPWNISDHDRSKWIDKMILFHKIKGKLFPVNEIINCLELINNKFWQKAVSLIPVEWQTDHLNRIKNHLNLIINSKAHFVKNLTWVTK